MKYENDYEWSETHRKFTIWIKKVIQHARIDYLRHINRQISAELLDEINEEYFSYEDTYNMDGVDLDSGSFDFEDELVERAFSKLTLKRRKILLMLFVGEYSPSEVADNLSISINRVYVERCLALKFLRNCLKDGENDDD